MKHWSVEFSTVYWDLHDGKFKVIRGKFGEVPRIRSVAILKSPTAQCTIPIPVTTSVGMIRFTYLDTRYQGQSKKVHDAAEAWLYPLSGPCRRDR
jgi:hypothetical protein